VAVAGATLAVAATLVLASGQVASSSEPVAYCPIPSGATAWAFHAGVPITGATGTYAHGHGSVSGGSAAGVICQVDRARGAPDRQIILSIHSLISLQHAVPVSGALGNVMRLGVRVKSSTDPKCKVGTAGQAMIVATYNGAHHDSVELSFPSACRRHRHDYTGTDVVALVPP
jgi:hypothetical protein